MKHTLRQNPSSERGVVLLISVLVASVALAIGIGVYQRTYKELYFSSFWKQTQISAAAADSGLECAMYWQFHSGVPACFGSNLVGWTWGTSGNFSADVSGGCVKVEITTTGTATTTKARGYNAVCTTVDAGTNPRVVERGLEVTYGSS